MPRYLLNAGQSQPRFGRQQPWNLGANGMIFYYTGYGGTAGRDLVCNAYGTPVGMHAGTARTPTPWNADLACTFDGTDDFIDFPWNRLYLATQAQLPGYGQDDVSILTWAYFNNNVECIGMEQGTDLNTTVSFGWGLNSTGKLAIMHANDYQAATTFQPSVGQWYHIAIIRNANAKTVRYLVNNGLTLDVTNSYSVATGDGTGKTLTLGSRGNATLGSTSGRGLYFAGYMADIRVYPFRVDQAVVWAAYNSGTRFVPRQRRRRIGAVAPALPTSPAPPPVFGGPVIGSPFFKFLPQSPLPNVQAPPPVVVPPTTPIIVSGGPVRGAPWYRQRPTQDAVGVNVPAPPAPQQIPVANVSGGPLPFAPWNQGRQKLEQPSFVPAPVVVPSPPAPPNVSGGPSMFTPYALRMQPVQPVSPPAPPPAPPPPAIALTPPLMKVPSDDRRIAHFTEVVSNIINSLFRQGELVRIDSTTWQIVIGGSSAGVSSFNGRTGIVTFGAGDLPASGVTAGTYPFATVSIDTTGRITSAQIGSGAKGSPLIGQGPTSAPIFSTRQVAIDSRLAIIGSNVTSSGGTFTFDLSVSDYHRLILADSSTTLALSNTTGVRIFTIELVQDGNGNRSVGAWFTTIKWAGGSAPTLTAAAGKTDVFTFINEGGGVYLGFIAGQNC